MPLAFVPGAGACGAVSVEMVVAVMLSVDVWMYKRFSGECMYKRGQWCYERIYSV